MIPASQRVFTAPCVVNLEIKGDACRNVRADHPELPEVIPGGAPNNPMGTRAMVLDSGEVAIHGTTQKMRGSIGSAASYGCIRMLNEDVADLYGRVHVGTRVIMEP